MLKNNLIICHIWLYKEEIYTEQDFVLKKSNWIDDLKNVSYLYNENEFLIVLAPLIKENVLSSEELGAIKYIISGKYLKDRLKKEQELRDRQEEEAKQKREEIINNVKSQTKEIANKTFDKINDILKSKPEENLEQRRVCECGQEIKEEFVFCTNCGRRLK